MARPTQADMRSGSAIPTSPLLTTFDSMPVIGMTRHQLEAAIALQIHILADLFHTLPFPEKWKEKWDAKIGWMLLNRTRDDERHIGVDPHDCIETTWTYTWILSVKDFCEPNRTVVIVEAMPAGSAGGGGGITVLGSGGSASATAPVHDWKVVRFEVGTAYHYEFRRTERRVVKHCPHEFPMVTETTLATSDPAWVLVSTNPNGICGSQVIADGIRKEDDAKSTADKQAPAGSGILRGDSAAGLKDQT